ncbi:MAG: F0F1 ATP synthase subunit A [Candidatus Dojkabacteria bacterium]|nr:F0F1 ATP synthase subunit A [Candidatus Dojkabacteria bacterium]
MEHSIGAQEVFSVAGLHITNTMLASIIVTITLIITAIVIRIILDSRPSKLQSLLELAIEYIYGICESVSDSNRAKTFFPWVMTFFLFIMFNIWFGITPLVGPLTIEAKGHTIELFKGATTDLNATFALAIVSFVLIQFFAFKLGGIRGWFSHYFKMNPIYLVPIFLFVGILELGLEFVKAISLSFRLFGNSYAGESLIANMTTINGMSIPFVTVPFLLLEVLVGIIQALVFSLLTLVFLSMITSKH